METNLWIHRNRRRGTAMILSLVMLVLCASLATAFLSTVSLELKKSDNLQQAQQAQLAAESGLGFLSYVLCKLELGSGLRDQALLDDLASALQRELNGTRNIGDGAVTYDGNRIVVPSIATAQGQSFTATLTMLDATDVRLIILAQSTDGAGTAIRRSLSLDFTAGSRAGSLQYGIYSKGPIVIEQNFEYRGVNTPAEASLYTEAEAGFAVTIGGNGYVDGDIDLKHEFGLVSLGMNTEVNGDVNVGVPPCPIPQVDPGVFERFATNVMDGSTPLQNVTLTNLRIPANTNPEFGSNVILRGVIYVEAPNYVYFKNNVDVIGVIVAKDPGEGGGVNKVEFKNNLNITGVENLLEPEFAELRRLIGSAILVPGFDLEFKNNFGTMSGTIACEQLLLKNNLAATVKGSLIIYGTGGLTFKNNGSIKIDRSSIEGLPAGLSAPGPTVLTADPDTYQELR